MAREAERRHELDARPSSVARARRIVRETLASAGRDDPEDVAQLVASELVTNALLHAGTPLSLTVLVDGDSVLIEVEDASPHLPAERNYATLAGTGRGLAMVHRLSRDWGARPTATGKAVWARLAGDRAAGLGPGPEAGSWERSPEESDRPRSPRTHGSARVRVRLMNVPLLMHLAWHQHAEALMREYLLARLETDEAVALEEHALASDAMALLHEQIPPPPLPGGARRVEDVAELLTTLAEPVPTLQSGWLDLPEEALLSFRVLDTVIEEALALANANVLLAAPVQPELRELRRWICAEVAGQSRGAEPRPWAPPVSKPAPDDDADWSTWDTRPVDRSTKALVAADDTDRIIAVSAPALALLGYDDAAELLGLRLLALIPQRFHQAHLAGFTMFLTSGRRPLLDAAVTLPFVRRDGGEVTLRTEVRVLSTAGDRQVFLAELDRAD